jgi:superoxide reductase
MTEKNEIYKCNICGNVVEVLDSGAGELVCCGKPMNKQNEMSHDEGEEKHLPVIEKEGNKITVKVGSIPHPMEEEHYIEWIEINMLDVGRIEKKYLNPGDAPEIEFHGRGENFKIRAYCNKHGLWGTK